jgi:hypothetical protein
MKNVCVRKCNRLTTTIKAMRLDKNLYRSQLEENGVSYGMTKDGRLILCGMYEDELKKRLAQKGLYVLFYNGEYRLQNAEGFQVIYSLKNPNELLQSHIMQKYQRTDNIQESNVLPYTWLNLGVTEQDLIHEQITYTKRQGAICIKIKSLSIFVTQPLDLNILQISRRWALVYDRGGYELYTEKEFEEAFGFLH